MYRIGIDLGGTRIKGGIIDENFDILCEMSIPTKIKRPYEEIIADMATLAENLITEMKITKDQVAGIGIGSPGMIDAQSGIIRYSNNFNWTGVPIVDMITQLTGLPSAVSNDANCAALGEMEAGAGKNHENVILLTLGTGVGSGIVINGKIFEGGHAGGAEFGHTVLIAGGEPCSCGRQGCVESYVSASALVRDTKLALSEHPESLIRKICEDNPDNINGKTAFDAAEMGDIVAQSVVDTYLSHLADAIVNLINVFRPDIILLGGGVCKQGVSLVDPVNELVRSRCFGAEKAFVPQVHCAALDNRAGLVGAAALISK